MKLYVTTLSQWFFSFLLFPFENCVLFFSVFCSSFMQMLRHHLIQYYAKVTKAKGYRSETWNTLSIRLNVKSLKMLHLPKRLPRIEKFQNKATTSHCISLSNEFIFNIPNGICYVRMICSESRLMPTDSFCVRKTIEKHNLMYSYAHQHVKRDLSKSNKVHIRFVIRIPFHHTNVFIFWWFAFKNIPHEPPCFRCGKKNRYFMA